MNDSTVTESRTIRWAIPLGVFLSTLLLVGSTMKNYGVAWDEPAYFYAADLHTNWLIDAARHLAVGELGQELTDQRIQAAWHWNPYNVPHPPFSRIISGWTKVAFEPFLDKVTAYRIGPALFFATLVTVMYLWIKELFGIVTALFAGLALVTTPNLFGYAHLAVTDLPLASMWFIAAFCFWKGLVDWQWSIALGAIWGLALATKFPALLIPLPLILWAHIFHRDKYANNIFAMLFLGPILMIASQPYLWHQTGARLLEFLYEGLSRGYRPDANFMIYFFDQLYFTQQLPWYYPMFIIAVTTQETLVLLALVGSLSVLWVREFRPAVSLFFINLIFIVLLGLAPGAVLHDGVRQLLSALPFLAALAAVGFHALVASLVKVTGRFERSRNIANVKIKIAATALLFAGSILFIDLVIFHPFELSFYNRFVGGIKGAYERGLETTYFLEALNPHFLRHLNDTLPPNAVLTGSFANFMLNYYQREGRLRRDIKIASAPPFDFYLLLNRRSVLGPRERNLMNSSVKPFASVMAGDVPLVSVFDFRTAR